MERGQREEKSEHHHEAGQANGRNIELTLRQQSQNAGMARRGGIRMEAVMQTAGSRKDFQHQEERQTQQRREPPGIPASQRQPCSNRFHARHTDDSASLITRTNSGGNIEFKNQKTALRLGFRAPRLSHLVLLFT